MPINIEDATVSNIGNREWCCGYSGTDIRGGGTHHMDYSDMSECRARRTYLRYLNRVLLREQAQSAPRLRVGTVSGRAATWQVTSATTWPTVEWNYSIVTNTINYTTT